MKIFITGIAGFLGANLAEYYLSKKYKVSGCDNLIGGTLDNIDLNKINFLKADCENLDEMTKIIKDVDVVVHTAAYPHEGLSSFSPYLICKSNYIGSISVFTAAIQNNVKRVVFCSSMARYGDIETPFFEEQKVRPVDPYGVSKLAAENTLKILADTHGIEYNIAVPHNIIGPKQKYDDPYRNVVSIMINRVLNGKAPIVYGDGEQVRCFSDIDDVVNPLVNSLTNKKAEGETINVGPDEDAISIKDLSLKILNVLNSDLEPIFVDPRPQEVKFAHCSAEKSRKLLDYKTTVSLDESIEKIANWIIQRGPKKFRYHLDVEILNEKTPKTWKNKLI